MWEAYEERATQRGFSCIAGVDEVGRGSIAGPVFAAAVSVTPSFYLDGVRDSKQLSAAKRAFIYEQMMRESSVDKAIGIATVEEINEINILQASLLAMRRAVANLKTRPDYLLVDGRDKPEAILHEEAVIKGDAKVFLIALSSIFAKHERDQRMKQLALTEPHYGWEKNMGYATEKHRKAIEQFGLSSHHRDWRALAKYDR